VNPVTVVDDLSAAVDAILASADLSLTG